MEESKLFPFVLKITHSHRVWKFPSTRRHSGLYCRTQSQRSCTPRLANRQTEPRTLTRSASNSSSLDLPHRHKTGSCPHVTAVTDFPADQS